MEHIRLFEDFLNEADMKFTWKQQSKVYGKSAIGGDQGKRAWQMMFNGQTVAWLHNSGYLSNSLGGDSLDQWKVMFNAKGNNFTMAKKFEDSELDSAKKWAEAMYIKIANSTEADPSTFALKQRINIPVKDVKVTGPLKGIIKKLKEALGAKFGYYIGTDNTMQAIRYGKDVESTGRFHWARSGKPDDMVKMMQDALGDGYKVEHQGNNITVSINANN